MRTAVRACAVLVLFALSAVPSAAGRLEYPAEYNPVPDDLFVGAYGGYFVSYGPQESALTEVPNLLHTDRYYFMFNEMGNYEIDVVLFRMLGAEFIHNFSGGFVQAMVDSSGTTKEPGFHYRNLMAGASLEIQGPHPRHDAFLGVSCGYVLSVLDYPGGCVNTGDGMACTADGFGERRNGYYVSIYVRGIFLEHLTYKVRYVRLTLDRTDEAFLKTGNLGFSLGLRLL